MNVKGLFMFLALTGLATSCTNDEGLDGNPSAIGGSNEIQLVFGGSGEGVDYTKAIATAEETEMKDLEVYVFASDAKDGIYHYVETWRNKEAAPAAGEKSFVLQAAGSNKMAAIKPTEMVGLPYLKLFCIAKSKLYGVEGTSNKELVLKALTGYDLKEKKVTPEDATTADTFITTFTKKLGGDEGTESKVLTCPLTMSGVGETKISGSVSKVNIEMTRAVARFDIENDQASSRLTIEKLSVLNGRKNAPLFKDGALAPTDTDKKKAGELMNYGEINFTDFPIANRGEVTSALYVYPGAVSDSTMLLISGKYLNPNGYPVNVSYKIQVSMNGELMAIGRNNRYKLRIGNVTESQVNAAFEIEDWISGGGIQTKPENGKPTFLNDNILDAIKVIKPENGDKPAQSSTDPLSLRLRTDKGSFTLTTYANGPVEAEIEELTKAESWLTVSKIDTLTDETNPARKITTFTFAYDKATGAVPQTVTLRNSAASYDPALWTMLTINGPFKAAELSLVEGEEAKFTTGNEVTIDEESKAITATMYIADESFVKLKMASVDDVKIEAPEWLAVEPVKSETKAMEPVTYIMKIVKAVPSETTDATVKFINAADDTGKPATTEVKLKLKPSGLTLIKGTDDNNAVTVTPEENSEAAPLYTIKIDTDLLKDGSFTFLISSPEGAIAPDFSACKWLDITETGSWSSLNREAEYTATLKENAPSYEAFSAEFTNAIQNGGNVTARFVKV